MGSPSRIEPGCLNPRGLAIAIRADSPLESPAAMACVTPADAVLPLTAYGEGGRDSTTELWEDPLHPARGWNDVVQP